MQVSFAFPLPGGSPALPSAQASAAGPQAAFEAVLDALAPAAGAGAGAETIEGVPAADAVEDEHAEETEEPGTAAFDAAALPVATAETSAGLAAVQTASLQGENAAEPTSSDTGVPWGAGAQPGPAADAAAILALPDSESTAEGHAEADLDAPALQRPPPRPALTGAEQTEGKVLADISRDPQPRPAASQKGRAEADASVHTLQPPRARPAEAPPDTHAQGEAPPLRLPEAASAPPEPAPPALPSDSVTPPPPEAREGPSRPTEAPPLHRPVVAEPQRQVADALVRTREGQVEVILNPSELGRVTVVMGAEGDPGHLALLVERPETLDLIRRHSDQLLRDLRGNGMPEASLDILRQDSGGRRDRGGEQPGNGPAHRHAPAADDSERAPPRPLVLSRLDIPL